MAANKNLKKRLDALLAEVAETMTTPEPPNLPAKAKGEQAGIDLLGLFSDPIPLNRVMDPAKEVDGQQLQLLPSSNEVESVGAPSEAAQIQPEVSETGPALPIVDWGELSAPKRPGYVSQARQPLPPAHDHATIDPLLRTAADPNPAVARLALETLLEMGQAVKNYVLLLSLQPRSSLHPGGQAYLSYLLGQPVIYIPLGPFLMGSNPAVDELAELNEQPQHQVSLAGYWLARYPVTMARFQAFVQATGYRPAKVDFKPGYEHLPVVNVSWYEALAYCRWLSEQTGLAVTLPSEAEWEKGARGPDGRRYPWGNQPPTVELCNFNCSTPVGHYSPQGDSPYGVADMAGNAWEWTRSAYRPYPYNPADGREELEGDQARVVRGLTFNNPLPLTRCSYRYRLQPQLRLPSLGFRVAVCPV